MFGQSHCFLGIYQYFEELKVSCSRTLHGGRLNPGPLPPEYDALPLSHLALYWVLCGSPNVLGTLDRKVAKCQNQIFIYVQFLCQVCKKFGELQIASSHAKSCTTDVIVFTHICLANARGQATTCNGLLFLSKAAARRLQNLQTPQK